jgi:FtsP/CotA-like multicopper oxidase with cupredoxin domain
VPAPGHASPELDAGRNPLTLTVRQDGKRLCYIANGSADAPVIHVRQGAPLVIRLINEISDPAAIDAITAAGRLPRANPAVPETAGFYKVVPGLKHHATGATNLHVHGFPVSPVAPADDVLTVCVDPASGPAGCQRREFTYRYQLPRDMPEGLYWYHPHSHGEVQAQMLMGLAGALVVDGPLEDARRAAGIEEQVLIVRQTQDQDAGKAPTSPMIAAAPSAANGTPGGRTVASAIDTSHELLCASNSGIDEISLNGTPVPTAQPEDSALARYQIAPGQKQLWRVLNAATDAFLDLAIITEAGKPLPIEVIARDGFPLTNDRGRLLASRPTLDSQHVPPAGRIEFLVAAPPAGVKAYLVTHAIDTGCAGDRLPERRLALVTASADAAPQVQIEPTRAGARRAETDAPNPFSGVMARRVDRKRVIALAEYPRPGSDDQTDFYIVERRPGAVLKPYQMGDAPVITVSAGTTEEWIVENWTNELHAFHMHQVHFRVLETDGVVNREAPLLDVVEVPYATATGYHSKEGPIRPGRVRIRVYFPASLAGDIPFHCHLVDHEDNGMMAVLRVVPGKSRH